MFSFRLFVPVTALAGFTACSTATSDTDRPAAAAPFAATIDGVSFSSTKASATLVGAGNFTITSGAAATGTSVTLLLYSIGKPGTYPLGVTPGIIGGAGQLTASGATLSTANSGTAGTVTVTAISLTRISGTFSFKASRATGFRESETRVVSDGRFDVAVTGSGTLEIPPNIGSSTTGSIDFVDFFATQITLVDNPSSGTLLLDLRQSPRKLTVEVSEFTGPGSYTLGTGVARRLRYDAPVRDFESTWGGSNSTTSGTVVVTSLTSSRIQGTVEATLTPTFAPLGTKPVNVSLRFDVGLP